ncbi:MAG TPA: hypothetical protein VIP56_11725, partial [Nitrososphaeraceae archaeon]
ANPLSTEATPTAIDTPMKRSPNPRLTSIVCESFCKNDELSSNDNLKYSKKRKMKGFYITNLIVDMKWNRLDKWARLAKSIRIYIVYQD